MKSVLNLPNKRHFSFYFIRYSEIYGSINYSSERTLLNATLSYDVASGSKITPCNKIDKPLVVYRLTGNVMTSITTLRT